MNSALKKGINFDLDTQALQGSGYHSTQPMSEAKAMFVVYQMLKKLSWLRGCVSICTISDVPELYDISHVFAKAS